METVTLVTPVLVSPGATTFRVWALDMRRAHPDRPAGILVIFREADAGGFIAGGKSWECRYEGDEADQLIVALNKVNLSTTSLEKRLMQRCQVDVKLPPGSIGGTPD
jgi:hypothetical protein